VSSRAVSYHHTVLPEVKEIIETHAYFLNNILKDEILIGLTDFELLVFRDSPFIFFTFEDLESVTWWDISPLAKSVGYWGLNGKTTETPLLPVTSHYYREPINLIKLIPLILTQLQKDPSATVSFTSYPRENLVVSCTTEKDLSDSEKELIKALKIIYQKEEEIYQLFVTIFKPLEENYSRFLDNRIFDINKQY